MSCQARGLSILLLVVQKILVAVVEVIILFILMKFPKLWSDFGAGNDFLGVALVQYIDKRSIFGVGSSTNRYSLTRGFQITTQRLDATTCK